MKKIILGLLSLVLLTSLVVALPNPASVYCEQQGYNLEIRNDPQGNQYGVCIDNCGNECEEWAFYRGECSFPLYHFWYIQGNKCLEVSGCRERMLPSFPTYATKKECKKALAENRFYGWLEENNNFDKLITKCKKDSDCYLATQIGECPCYAGGSARAVNSLGIVYYDWFASKQCYNTGECYCVAVFNPICVNTVIKCVSRTCQITSFGY